MRVEEITFWEAFQEVAKYKSFSKAADKLRMPLPQLSKRVAKLEDRLGVKLFRRTTRVVTLTDEGKALLPRVIAILEDLTSIESTFEGAGELAGTIRLASVPFVAQRLLIPSLEKFCRAYPQVRFELDLSERIQDLIESNIDIAIRIHDKPDDTSLVYRKLAENNLVLCASKKYLDFYGMPTEIEDLAKHKVLMLNIHRRCLFQNSDQTLGDLKAEKPFECENGWFLTELALQGLGILVRSSWDVDEHLKSGKLIPVLPKHPLNSFGQIYAVIPSRKFLAIRVRTFLDFVIGEAASWKYGESERRK